MSDTARVKFSVWRHGCYIEQTAETLDEALTFLKKGELEGRFSTDSIEVRDEHGEVTLRAEGTEAFDMAWAHELPAGWDE